MLAPSKENLIEPDISPIRKNLNDESPLKRFFQWRTGRRHFRFNKEWIVWVEYLQIWVKIPEGFVFDGASVPKAFHSFINSIDAMFYGSILHDFIYRTDQLIFCDDDHFGDWILLEDIGKVKADNILFQFSKQMEGIVLPNAVGYGVLAVLGWIAWGKARYKDLHLVTSNPIPENPVLGVYN